MPNCGGYAGKVIKIDLCSKTISEYPWGIPEREQYLGGKIMAARILRDHLTGKETAFSEENPIVITTGPLTGTGAPGSVRFDLASLSPKDDLPAFSNCGGNFGVGLKKAGYDALILTGRCKEKCWLEIREDSILFHNAGDLWGTRTGECQETLTRLLGTGQFGRLCIGPAGENLVKFASVIGDGHSAGRAGIGAVLGWKNLKAVTVTGNKEIAVHAPEEAAARNKEWHAYLRALRTDTARDNKASCPGCPLHCARHLHTEKEALLNDLGMDAIAAEDAALWAAEQGISVQGLYEDIAFRHGIGDKLAEGAPRRKGKSGKRRGGSYGAIMEAFRLSPDDPEAQSFCRALTEAVCAAGQCMFTVNALRREEPVFHVIPMLHAVTGMDIDPDRLVRIGRTCSELEQQLRDKFRK